MSSTSFRQDLVDELRAQGRLTDPAWQAAVEAVPREVFLGDAVFRPDGTQWRPVCREEFDEEDWLRMVYADTTWVTQVDGMNAAEATGRLAGRPTSSSTLPSLVVRMVELAEIGDGDKVLEIGTGTGYSTAVLCHRLGDHLVYSVEYDEELATSAAQHLHAAGRAPTAVVGDGLRGHQDGAE
ncbi:Protein-L-isoaspartate carboxylmethyltransferase [Streptomyces sp. WMMB 322]|nr:Protein-L-isoaspartate carboxylmethyltransferase [Streptomyces sp. WMMB 322]